MGVTAAPSPSGPDEPGEPGGPSSGGASSGDPSADGAASGGGAAASAASVPAGTSPRTADDADLALWALLALGCAAGIVLCVRRLGRNR